MCERDQTSGRRQEAKIKPIGLGLLPEHRKGDVLHSVWGEHTGGLGFNVTKKQLSFDLGSFFFPHKNKFVF